MVYYISHKTPLVALKTHNSSLVLTLCFDLNGFLEIIQIFFKKSPVAALKKNPPFCVMCTLMSSASLIWIIFIIFSCCCCTEKHNLLLSILCFYIMCFLDLIKLDHFIGQQLHTKTPCLNDRCFVYVIRLYIFSASSFTEKYHLILLSYILDLIFFLNAILNYLCP